MPFNIISVVGLGYIGLPTAAMFASRKKHVIGVDVNKKIVDSINAGKVHIAEPELDILVRAVVTEGYLRAVTTPEPADVFLIAVPTPFFPKSAKDDIPQPDLRFIESAAQVIAVVLKKGDLVILESTSPVGTTEKMAAWLAEVRPDLTFPQTHGNESDIRVAYCPERVLPGHVIRELVVNSRVIGGMTENCSEAAIALYKTFVEGECVVTTTRTAEMTKLTENASRDVSIAFANELSIVCDSLDIDVWELISLANRHPRVNILKPGPGVGGHCIAVDPWFIVSQVPEKSTLMHAARNINDRKPLWVLRKIKKVIVDFLADNTNKCEEEVIIALYGLAFKQNINDLRESPSLAIADEVGRTHKGIVYAVEPNIRSYDQTNFDLVSIQKAYSEADIHVLLVSHTEFKNPKLSSKYFLDTCGLWS